ncbi:MAG: cytochrome [Hyphomicrobiales bacterium]|nr:cytochrome [Hyphomicrobiales bacterium]
MTLNPRAAQALSVALFPLALLTTTAARGADADNGERLSGRWCAECHVVAPDQKSAKADAPSFAAISASRRIPEISSFLKQSHPQMPDMSLSRDEIADIIAWMQRQAPPLDPQRPGPDKDDPKLPGRG